MKLMTGFGEREKNVCQRTRVGDRGIVVLGKGLTGGYLPRQ